MAQLLTRGLVESIGSFNGGGRPVTSVYLGLSPTVEGRRQARTRLKDLISANWDTIMSGRSREDKASIEADIDAFSNFIEQSAKIEVEGLAMYSCSDRGFFDSVGVKMPFRPQVIVASRPAVAPLMAAIEEFRRVAVCVVDRRAAKLYEYFMGQIEEVRIFSDDVPSRVKVGGWAGYEESKITRHVQQHEYNHFKNVADVLFEQFKMRGFDWLFLGVRPEVRDIMDHVLHAYVRERVKAYIDASVNTPLAELRKTTIETAERLKAEEGRRAAEQVITVASQSNLGVTGFKGVLEALNMAAVATLLVKEGNSMKGVICDKCGTLGLRRADCAGCGGTMTAVDNIVTHAEQVAAAQGAVVRHLKTDSTLDAHEGIGALLRYPIRPA